MTEKNENSNTNIRIDNICVDPRKNYSDFPCGWMTFDGKCRWKGEKKCVPIRIDWFILDTVDSLKDVKF